MRGLTFVSSIVAARVMLRVAGLHGRSQRAANRRVDWHWKGPRPSRERAGTL